MRIMDTGPLLFLFLVFDGFASSLLISSHGKSDGKLSTFVKFETRDSEMAVMKIDAVMLSS